MFPRVELSSGGDTRLRETVPLKFPMLDIVMIDEPDTVTLNLIRFGVDEIVKSGTGTIRWIVIEFGGTPGLVPVIVNV